MVKKLAYIRNFSYLCSINRRYGEGRIVEASADDATSAGDGNGANLCGRSIRFYGKRPADINDTLPC
jgi:hypothetical protein